MSLALAVPAAAQTFPLPASDTKPLVTCTGCAGQNVHQQDNNGLKTVGFSAPITAHVGRLIDSSSTQHYQGPGFRTGRGGKIMTARTQRGSAPPRAYVRIGEAIFAWRLDSFFSSALPGGTKSVNTFASSVSGRAPSRPPYEQLLMPEAFCYPEHRDSGWTSGAGDVQNTFGDMDFDDRGYIYAGMKDHGWGIVKDSGETAGTSFPLVSPQMSSPLTPQVLVSLKAGNKYYVAISNANALEVVIYDVTTPSNPTPLFAGTRKDSPFTGKWGMKRWAKSASGDRFAYYGGDDKLHVYDPAAYIAGGASIIDVAPTAGSKREFLDLEFDESGNIWLAEGREGANVPNVLRKLTKSGSTYTVTDYNVYTEAFSPHKIHVSDGYVVLSGWGSGFDGVAALDVKLFKIEGAGLREIDLNDFFSKYYHRPPAGFAQPQALPNTYCSSPMLGDVHIIRWGGKLYLMYNAWGIGDVYQLDDGGSITASMKTTSFGTKNPFSKGTGGPFYGDLVTFAGTSSVPGSGGLVYDFGNPEAGTSANIKSVNNGADVTHQYIGLSTAGTITSPKVVTIYEANDQSVTSTLQVNLKLPAPRVGLPDGSVLTASSSLAGVVAGETLNDASDGVIAGHFATWTLDGGTPVKALPTTPMAVGGVGPHTMTFTGSYGQYDADTFATTKPMYTTAPISITYEARPFVFSFNPATKTGSTVTFSATPRKTTDAAIMTATQATATWTLKSGGVDVVPPHVATITNFSAPFKFDVSSTIPNNSVLSLTLSVDPNGLSTAAQPYKDFTQSMTLEAPAPTIAVSGCQNANANCTFTAGGSITGATLKWTLTLNGTQVATGTEPTFSPSIANAGTYVISLAATKTVFTTTAQQNITVAQSLCGPPPSVDFVTIWASCTTNCGTNTDISFRADFYGYVPQACDEWVWSFGDGQSSTLTGVDGMFASHKYTSNNTYTVRLTIKNSVNQTVVAPITVVVGSGTPPPPTCNAATSASFTYSGSKGCRAGIDCKEGEIITFTPRKNNGSLQSCDSASWRFGDNTSSATKNATKSYTTKGTYEVNLTVINQHGAAEAAPQSIKIVEDVNTSCSRAPTDVDFYPYFLGRTSGCSFSNSKLCTPGEIIEFKAQPFFGYTFQACDRFEWRFGDGSTSTSKEAEHIYPANDNTFVATLRVHNSFGGAELTATIRFDGAPAVPPPVLTAAFPKTGSKGATVTFVADSTLDTTTGWTWDFGDGTPKNTSQASTTSNRSTITHTFAAAGTYTVTASARNGLSASTALTAVATDRITISDVPTYRFLLPAVIHAGGLNGSSWRSDVQVYYGAPNPATEPLKMSAEFNGQVSQLEINKSTFIYEDFVLTLTGKDGQGSVLLTTQSKYKPQIWTRTYSVDATGRTFGQFIPAVEITGASGASVDTSADPVKYYLAGLREDSRYRTNLGFINPNSTAVTANVVVYDDLRIPLTQFAVPMDPYQLVAINGLKNKVSNLPNRPVTLEITVPAGNWLVAYASFIDGFSNDPAYIPAIAETALAGTGFDKGITPGVGHIGDWRSDVTIFNPDSAGVRVDLTYYDAVGLPRAEAKDVFIGAGQVKTYSDLLKTPGLWTSNPPDGLGMLMLKTTTPVTHYPLTFSRTYNDKGTGGTFGQGIPGFAAVNANVKPGVPGIIPAVRNDANYKTNIGLTNTTANAVNVTVHLLDPNTGAVAQSLSVPLSAYQSVVGTYDFGTLSSGTFKVEITGGTGAVWAFASIINQGNDPEYVPAIPLQ